MAVNLGRNEEQFTMASGDLFKGEVKQNLREVFELQTQRVHIWNEFDLRFKEYTLDAPSFELKKLQLICKEIGEQLNSVSMQIIRIKEKFSSDVYNVKSLYELLEQLQSNEQMKFQLTLELYVCEQERLEKLAYTDEHEFVYRGKINDLKKKLNETKLKVNECLEELRYELHDS